MKYTWLDVLVSLLLAVLLPAVRAPADSGPVADPLPPRHVVVGERAIDGAELVPRLAPPIQRPNPRWFKLKWRTPPFTPQQGSMGRNRIAWQVPSRHFVARQDDVLTVYDAHTGTPVRTIRLADAAKELDRTERFLLFDYLRAGDSGVLVALRPLLETHETAPGEQHVRAMGYEVLGIGLDGQVLWKTDFPQGRTEYTLQVIPVAEDRDGVAMLSHPFFAVLDDAGDPLVEQPRSSADIWSVRLNQAGDGVEIISHGQDTSCYELRLPTSVEPPTERFEKRWTRPVEAAGALARSPDRITAAFPPRFLTAREGLTLSALCLADGRAAFTANMPRKLVYAEGQAHPTEFVFVREGDAPFFCALRVVRGRREDEGPAYAIHLSAHDEEGREAWYHPFEEVDPAAKMHALPLGPGQTGLLLELWDRAIIFSAKGRILAEIPFGRTAERWLLTPDDTADAFNLLVCGREITCYQWRAMAEAAPSADSETTRHDEP